MVTVGAKRVSGRSKWWRMRFVCAQPGPNGGTPPRLVSLYALNYFLGKLSAVPFAFCRNLSGLQVGVYMQHADWRVRGRGIRLYAVGGSLWICTFGYAKGTER